MATTTARRTRRFEDFVTSYVSLLKQTESNQIALGREAFAAREFCRSKKISFVKFCEACNMPRRTIYDHIRTFQAYEWLRTEKGVSKTAIGSLPAGSIIQLQELLTHDPDGAEDLVAELLSADKKRAQLKLADESDANKAAKEELKKHEERIRAELEQKYREKVKRARDGAKEEISLLEKQAAKAEEAHKEAKKAVAELKRELTRERQKLAAKEATEEGTKLKAELDAAKAKTKEYQEMLDNYAHQYTEVETELKKLKRERGAKARKAAKELATEKIAGMLSCSLGDAEQLLEHLRDTIGALDEPDAVLAHCTNALFGLAEEFGCWDDILKEAKIS